MEFYYKVKRLEINDKQIDFNLFDYDLHKKKQIHNEGLDIISNCIYKKGCWSTLETELLIEIMKGGGHNFIDLGCHIGFFSVIANSYNNNVLAIDKNENFVSILEETIEDNNLTNLNIKNMVIDENVGRKFFEKYDKIRCVKISLNGQEVGAINLFKNLLKEKKIDYLFINFKKDVKGYIFLLKVIQKYGYKIYDLGIQVNNKFSEETNHLKSINKYSLQNKNLKNYLNNLEFNETLLLLEKK